MANKVADGFKAGFDKRIDNDYEVRRRDEAGQHDVGEMRALSSFRLGQSHQRLLGRDPHVAGERQLASARDTQAASKLPPDN